jgi:Zn-dependent protease
MNQAIYLAALLPALIFAIVFHEVAHGLMARALGDRTAEEMNRLSLNPLRHVDLIGTIVLPGFLALIGAPVLGWAKPVPINGRRLRNPRRDMMLVAAAGPGMNLVMAALAAVGLGMLIRGLPVASSFNDVPEMLGSLGLAPAFLGLVLLLFISLNVFLALFNLLPIPPLDGSHIVEGVLPDGLRQGYARLRNMGMMLPILLLVVLPSLIPGLSLTKYLFGPVDWTLDKYLSLANLFAGF